MLAEAKQGQKLMRIDGRYYAMEENCVCMSFDKNADYNSGNGFYIITEIDQDKISEFIWTPDGGFYKRHIIEESIFP